MKHFDSRSDFKTDEAFANFRALILNNRESNYFYRSASVVTNYYGRASTVKQIMGKKGIKHILDLSNIRFQCESDEFAYELIKRIRTILSQPGPFIIQCDAGKKRTGFACIILEALSGTSYDNIVKDYLKSYENNNRLELSKNPVLVARIIVGCINSHIEFIADSNVDISSINLQNSAKDYLKKYGLSSKEITELQLVLSK